MLIDSHCHLADSAFAQDSADVLERAWATGVAHVIVIGESPEAIARALTFASTDQRVSATAGLHPHEARRWDEGSAGRLREALRDPRVVAVGEMGLDYHYDYSPRETQRRVFEEQLALAAEAGKPAIIHAREADDEVCSILRNHPSVTGVLHSFSSGMDLLRVGLALGHYVSFSGMITFKNWRLDHAIVETPLDRLLLETDSPYLAPVPQRGRRNEPALVRFVAERVAAVRGVDVSEIIEATGRNAATVFGARVGDAIRRR